MKHSPQLAIIQINIEYIVSNHDCFSGVIRTKIIDNGPGMDLEKFKKTSKMFQPHSDQDSETVGIGIGLSTAESLAKSLGGQVSIRSPISLV